MLINMPKVVRFIVDLGMTFVIKNPTKNNDKVDPNC